MPCENCNCKTLPEVEDCIKSEIFDDKIPVRFKKLHPDAIVPTYAKEGDAGADLYSVEDKFIPVGEVAMIDTGIAIQLPEGWEAQVRCRSGLAAKGLQIGNAPGTIDSGYRGEVRAIIHNFAYLHNSIPYPVTKGIQIKKGDRIAQLVIKPAWQAHFIEVEELDASDRGEGAYGSTGMR